MPFTILVLPTTAAPPRPAFEQSIQAMVSASAHPVGKGGDKWRTLDGITFRLDDRILSLERLSPGFCDLLFDTAQRTSAYIAMNGFDFPESEVGRRVANGYCAK
jgi:hypothetical protein